MRPWLWLVLIGGVLGGTRAEARAPLFDRGVVPLRIGAMPAGMRTRSAEECAGCHVAEAREWQESLHRQAWTQPLFQEAYRIEPMQECRNCHEPLTPTAGLGRAPRALQAEGVNCIVCHVREGQVLAGRPGGRAPHAVAAAPELATSEFCGGCHQFNFPQRQGPHPADQTDEPMQDTLAEWRHGGGPDAPGCQDCHMPWQTDRSGLRHRSHRFLGGYDAGLLRQAIAVRPALRRTPEGAVLALTLAARQVGHDVPTGDLYRSLVIEAEAVDGAGQVVTAPPARLQRHFATILEADGHGRPVLRKRQTQDDRLVPGQPQTLEFRFPGAAVGQVRYRLRLSRLPPGSPPAEGGAALTTIDEGTIPLGQGETS